MTNGIAIYNTQELSPSVACELGELFFRLLNLTITGAGYYTYLERGDHPGDHDIVETSLADLKSKIASNDATAFRIYAMKKGHSPWLASFGYSTNDFSNFFHLDAQFPEDQNNLSALVDFFKQITLLVKLPYGFIYSCKNTSQALHYASGANFISLFPYENPSIWEERTSIPYEANELLRPETLRLIYPYNLINTEQLGIQINGMSLQSWIKNDAAHGSLKALNNGSCLWSVEQDNLEEVNAACASSGLLLSWKQPNAKKSPKKLP